MSAHHQLPRKYTILCTLLLGSMLAAGCTGSLPTATTLRATPIDLPGGTGGIGFDDLLYNPALRAVIVPAGRTGRLDLVDPLTREVTTLGGFSAQDQFGGGHGQGTTSADYGQHYLFAIDRTAMKLDVVDPGAKGSILASAPLAGNPDYIRYVAATNELWVTEPDSEQIEVFSLGSGALPKPVQAGLIAVGGGPESLVIDATREQAYTHLWNGMTVAIDLKTRTLVSKWPNGCLGSRGIALDETRGLLFSGCFEGKLVVLDLGHDGRQLASFAYGLGVDVIAYSPQLHHLYLPAATSAKMAILDVSPLGQLTLLGTVDTAPDAHCVTADDLGNAWVCDPSTGRLLLVKDNLPAEP